MSVSDSAQSVTTPPPIDNRMSLPLLLTEATRQLSICNACRYCEGLCAVFPALERRVELGPADVSQLANLCHDCRACYDACMYSPPHLFDIDLPKALSAVRVTDYQRHVWPARVPRVLCGWSGVALGATASAALVLILAVIHAGWGGLIRSSGTAASPYELVPYPVLVALMLAAAVYAVVIMLLAARSYWRSTNPAPTRVTARAVMQAVWYAATLRYLRGGGVECYYPEDDKPSAGRRHLHAMVAYGFGLCLMSTITAGAEQDLAGIEPPYPWLSVPVLAGVIGGIALVVGCLGLLALKARSSQVTSFAQMTIKDYGLLIALALLALSGLAVLLTRDTAAYGIILLVHLAALVEAFAMAPYSKFVHIVFRFAALVKDNLERAGAASRN